MKRYRWWNSPGFRDDDGSLQWRDVARMYRSRWHVLAMRLDNRWQDARARLAGACNADLWTGETPYGYAGGYLHWRCGKRRGHDPEVNVFRDDEYVDVGMYGTHRFNNYTWSGKPGDRPQYDPLPIRNADNSGFYDTRQVIPFRKLAEGRRAVDTRRRSRLRAKWAEQARAERAARPRVIVNPFVERSNG